MAHTVYMCYVLYELKGKLYDFSMHVSRNMHIVQCLIIIVLCSN
jgi:hypothetical protein